MFNNLKSVGLQVYRNVKFQKGNTQLGEIDVLVIDQNKVYFLEVKGIDKFNGIFEFYYQVQEKLEAEAVEQLLKAINYSRDEVIKFYDHEHREIQFPKEFETCALTLTNHFVKNSIAQRNIRICNLVELTMLCTPKLQNSFLKILEWYYPDKSVIPYYQELFANAEKHPEFILSFLQEGTFWKYIKEVLA